MAALGHLKRRLDRNRRIVAGHAGAFAAAMACSIFSVVARKGASTFSATSLFATAVVKKLMLMSAWTASPWRIGIASVLMRYGFTFGSRVAKPSARACRRIARRRASSSSPKRRAGSARMRRICASRSLSGQNASSARPMAVVTRSGRNPSTVLVCTRGLIVPVQNLMAIASPSSTPMPIGHFSCWVSSIAKGRAISMICEMPSQPDASSCTRLVTQ